MPKNSIKILFILIIIGFYNSCFCQVDFISKILGNFNISGSLNYVSSATIQLNPNNSDLFERNATSDVKGGYGYGFALKRRIFNEDIFIGISTEYIKINDNQQTDVVENATDVQTVHVTETLEMIPFEVSMYFNIPKFTENLNIYLGGGFGFYFGNRVRKMVGLETTTLSKDPKFSLNVLFGSEYFLDKHFTANLEVKVRDGVYVVHSRFPTDRVVLDGQTYFFQQDLNSKIFIDGLKISVGVGYYF